MYGVCTCMLTSVSTDDPNLGILRVSISDLGYARWMSDAFDRWMLWIDDGIADWRVRDC